MADCSISFFDGKWRHHDISAIVNNNYVLANFSVILANWWNLDSANQFNNVTLCLSVGNDEFIILSKSVGRVDERFWRFRGGLRTSENSHLGILVTSFQRSWKENMPSKKEILGR